MLPRLLHVQLVGEREAVHQAPVRQRVALGAQRRQRGAGRAQRGAHALQARLGLDGLAAQGRPAGPWTSACSRLWLDRDPIRHPFQLLFAGHESAKPKPCMAVEASKCAAVRPQKFLGCSVS